MSLKEAGILINNHLMLAENNLVDLIESTDTIKEMRALFFSLTKEEQSRLIMNPLEYVRLSESIKKAFGNPSEEDFIKMLAVTSEILAVSTTIIKTVESFNKENLIPGPKKIAKLSKSFMANIDDLDSFHKNKLDKDAIDRVKENLFKALMIAVIEL